MGERAADFGFSDGLCIFKSVDGEEVGAAGDRRKCSSYEVWRAGSKCDVVGIAEGIAQLRGMKEVAVVRIPSFKLAVAGDGAEEFP